MSPPPIDERKRWTKVVKESSEVPAHTDYAGVQTRLATFPPPVRIGAGSAGLPRSQDYSDQQKAERVQKTFSVVWKVATVVLAALAAGFGGAKALEPNTKADLKEIRDDLKANERMRQLDQRNTEATIASLHEEISVLKQTLKIAPTLDVKGR